MFSLYLPIIIMLCKKFSIIFVRFQSVSITAAHMIVEFHNAHNHATETPAALNKRDASADTRSNLLELFAAGYGAAESLAVLRYTILENCSAGDYSKLLSDRSILPDLRYVDGYLLF